MSMQDGLNIIIGLGKTGLSCVRYLLQQNYQVAVTDSRDTPPGIDELKAIAPDIPCEFGKISESLIAKASRLIVSPGIAVTIPELDKAREAGIPIIGDIELFAQRQPNIPVIGVTGSNGKSTVVTLLGEMVAASGKKGIVAGNIGMPVLDVIDKPADFFVLELSSFQLETTYSLHLKAASILNVTEDHMDRYAEFGDYVDAKQRIYHDVDDIVWNREDQNTFPQMVADNGALVSFAYAKPENDRDYGVMMQDGQSYLVKGNQLLLKESEMVIPGYCAVLNSLAALALGESVGLPLAAMLKAIREFKGLPHRCQLVGTWNDISWYNDSKATNPDAVRKALKTLSNGSGKNIILIAGGVGKDADFSVLQPDIKHHVKQSLLIGDAANEMKAACALNAKICKDLQSAVEMAKKYATAGDKVLLSPACASFDMFKDYIHRGETFVQLVKTSHEQNA